MKKTLITALTVSLLSVSAQAAEEKVLNVYNWSDYIAEDTIEKFEKETGIKVNYDVYDSNEVLEAKVLTGNTGYDIAVPTGDFLQRQISAGVYMPFDRKQLPNLKNMDKVLMAGGAAHDKNNDHSIIYMWGTTGIGYNVAKVKEALGVDEVPNSWSLVLDPANAKKLEKCGISMLDSPSEVLPSVLKYLGLEPTRRDKKTIDKAKEAMLQVRPYVRYFHSSQYIDDLAAGEICVALGWSGDVFQAQADAADGVELDYFIPKEGALQWFDFMAILSDAPHPENAHKFINFIMKPEITADITNYVWYANANAAATPFVNKEILEHPGIFPSEETKKNLWQAKIATNKQSRIINRAWDDVKSGK